VTALNFRPAPGAAPPVRRVWSHALVETKLLVRNGEQLVLALVIPLGILILGHVVGSRFGDLTTLAPSVLALAVWSSAFTSVAIATGFERRYGVLERLASTPLGRTGLLAGKAGAVIMIVLGQMTVLVMASLALGWRPLFTPLSAVAAIATVILAVATYVGLALALAGRLRAEATLGLANLIYVILLAGGALVVPLARYPRPWQPIIELLPTAALGEGLRSHATGLVLGWPFVVLLGWLVVAAAAAWKGFRWTS